jgi:hypothetical protein
MGNIVEREEVIQAGKLEGRTSAKKMVMAYNSSAVSPSSTPACALVSIFQEIRTMLITSSKLCQNS